MNLLSLFFLCLFPTGFSVDGMTQVMAHGRSTVQPVHFMPNIACGPQKQTLVAHPEVAAVIRTPYGVVMFTLQGNLILNPNNKGSRELAPFKLGPSPKVQLIQQTSHLVHVLIGPKENWRTQIPTYQKLIYENAWEGIDLTYQAQADQLSCEMILAPGVSPAQVVWNFRPYGLGSETNKEEVRFQNPSQQWDPPRAWQILNGKKLPVGIASEVREDGRLGYRLGSYDPKLALGIGQNLSWSTFLGGEGTDLDQIRAMGTDSQGNVYLTGYTANAGFPITAGAFQQTFASGDDAFVSKISADGTGLSYSTFIGGLGTDMSYKLAVDQLGSVYITGQTTSSDFPVTPGAFDDSLETGDGFVVKLTPDGSDLSFSTFLGGAASDFGFGIDVDDTGSVYITGATNANDFPTTSGAFSQTLTGTNFDSFAVKFLPDGSDLVYGTYLGGSDSEIGTGIALDAAGNAHLIGRTRSSNFPTTPGAFDTSFNGAFDNYVVKLSADGANLNYSTFLGGSQNDINGSIAVDGAGCAYVSGDTRSTDFPVNGMDTSHNGLSDVYVAKFNATGSILIYATFIGGDGSDTPQAIVVDDHGYASITGFTESTNFPTTGNAFDQVHNGSEDAFMARVNPLGSRLQYSTFLGGSLSDKGWDLAVTGESVTIAGETYSSEFPVSPGAYDETLGGTVDVFITRLNIGCPLDLSGDGVINLMDGVLLISQFGSCSCAEDLNGDGDVDLGDILLLLPEWNTWCSGQTQTD